MKGLGRRPGRLCRNAGQKIDSFPVGRYVRTFVGQLRCSQLRQPMWIITEEEAGIEVVGPR